MRTALLASQKRTETGEIAAFLPLGGRSVLAWQFDLVRSLGCERVICLCEAASPEILDLQHEAEAAGVQFHAIKGPLQLVGLVTADHDLVMVLDGLVMEPSLARELSANGRSIASVPATSGLASDYPNDFERIDSTRAWAGLAIIRANLAEKLAELPADSNTMSLLLRLGLQAGVKDAPIDPESLTNGGILLATDPAGLEQRQAALIERSADTLSWAGPGQALAAWIAAKTAPRGLDQGPVIAGGIGGVAMLAMAALSWLDQTVIGLLSGAIGAFALALSGAGAGLKARLYSHTQNTKNSQLLNGLRDIFVITALCFAVFNTGANLSPMLVLPVLAVGLIRVVAASESGPWRAFWNDRTWQLIALATCTIFGQLTVGIAALALGALAHALLRVRGTELTQA